MKVFASDKTPLPLPAGHRFPGEKYTMLRTLVEEAGLAGAAGIITPEPASREQLLLVHTPEYVDKVFNGTLSEQELRRTGFPWSPELVERSRRSVGGTIAACRAALEDGIAIHLAGGTHHAYPDHGEGFCVFNDMAVAARVMQQEGLAKRLVFIDCDVHQGNGNAAIFAGDDSVFTFSIHGLKNFPFHKEIGDLDVALPDWTGDEAYMAALRPAVQESIARARADLAIYLAGADPYAGDRLGRMKLTKPGLAERDRYVITELRRAGLPVAVVMGGGYGKVISETVEVQLQTVNIVKEFSKQ